MGGGWVAEFCRGAKDGREGTLERVPADHNHECQCNRCDNYWTGWRSGVKDKARDTIAAMKAEQ